MMLTTSLKHVKNTCIKPMPTTILKSIEKSKQTFVVGYAVRNLSSNYHLKQKLKEDVMRFNGIRIQLSPEDQWREEHFEKELIESSKRWKEDKRRSVFIEVPIQLGHLTTIAAKYGFIYHSARDDLAVLCKWLVEDSESKIPAFANHQVGVAGACFRENTNELLVVRDKGNYSKWWKCPGGHSNIREFIGDTAVREVFEETGIETEFKSILSLRQQHDVFYRQSDLYFICRLNPLTFNLQPCPDEIDACEWMNVNKLLTMKNSTPFVKMICRLLLQGKQTGFDTIDMKGHEVESWVTKNKMMWIFHRPLLENS